MFLYGHTIFISVLLLLASEAIAVETDEIVENVSQEEAFPEDTIEEEVIAEEQIVTEDKGSGELPSAQTSTESLPEDNTTQEADEIISESDDEELMSEMHFRKNQFTISQ